MENDVDFQKEFSDQSDFYIKFVIYHSVILFTIVFSLLSGVNSIENGSLHKKVDSAKGLEKISRVPSSSLIKDELLEQMYFKQEDSVYENRNSLNDDNKQTYTRIDSNAAYEQQVKILNEIENTYKEAFIIKLTFLGDVQVDLRTWMFFLPFFLLFSIIYIFILDYKVSLIKKKAHMSGFPIPLSVQYPYNYLRPVFIAGQILLIFIYTYVLIDFLQYSNEFLKSLIFKGYVLLLYYGLIYCCYVVESLHLDNGINVKLILNVLLKRAIKKITFVLTKINPFICLRTGQALMFLTLFLVMSYDSCSSESKFNPKYALRGYELIITFKNWQSISSEVDGYFYKYLYVGSIVFTTLLIFVYYKKSEIYNYRFVKWGKVYFTVATLVYSIYFSFYDIFYEIYGIIFSSVFFMYWYYAFFSRIRRNWNSVLNQFVGYLLFLLPNFIFAIKNIIFNYLYQNGWIFFYIALYFIITGIVLIERKRKVVPS